MTKQEALNKFYNSFGLVAYPSHAVPKDCAFPFATYEVKTGSYGMDTSPMLQLWYHSESERIPNAKADEISKAIGTGVTIPCDDGIICIFADNPWNTLSDQADASVKRIYTTLTVRFETF